MIIAQRFSQPPGGGENSWLFPIPPQSAINCNAPIRWDQDIPVHETGCRASEPVATNCISAELGGSTPPGPVSAKIASNCTPTLRDRIADLTAASLSGATRRAYRADLDHFLSWGGTLPAGPDMVAAYLADQAGTLSIATLTRRLAAISKTHAAQGWPNPCRAERVRAVIRGIKRRHGKPQKQAKALTRDDLFAILSRLGDRLKDHRDRALLLIGFAGAFRRSELVGITVTDIERVPQGIVVTLPRSKTDQDGQGRKVAIPFGRTRHCPVAAMDLWLVEAGITVGPVFRNVTRHEHLGDDPLTPEAVSLILRDRVEAAGYDPEGFSGHSLRAGLATSAAQAGVPTHRIRAQTGHASDAMLARYIRDGEMFTGNAAGAVL